MQETEYDLFVSRPATVRPDGTAEISIGPDAAHERWQIVSTQLANDGPNATTCRIFNNPSRTQLMEGTFAGRLDTSDTTFNLRPNQKLYYVWSGGTPGSVCNLTIRGSKFIRGNRGGGL